MCQLPVSQFSHHSVIATESYLFFQLDSLMLLFLSSVFDDTDKEAWCLAVPPLPPLPAFWPGLGGGGRVQKGRGKKEEEEKEKSGPFVASDVLLIL